MNDETPDVPRDHAELAAGIAAVVRAWLADGADADINVDDATFEDETHTNLDVRFSITAEGKGPPLDTGRALGLAALVGDDTAASALADFLLEQGYDWATAVAEKARAEERKRIAAFVETTDSRWEATAYMCHEIAAHILGLDAPPSASTSYAEWCDAHPPD